MPTIPGLQQQIPEKNPLHFGTPTLGEVGWRGIGRSNDNKAKCTVYLMVVVISGVWRKIKGKEVRSAYGACNLKWFDKASPEEVKTIVEVHRILVKVNKLYVKCFDQCVAHSKS